MPEDRTDETARFMQIITAFSAAPEPVSEFGRRLSAAGDTVLSGILNEISETVLRRFLTFAAMTGEEVQLDVAERRVHRVLAIPMSWRSDHGALVGVDLSEGQAAELLRLLQRFASCGSELFVKAALPDREKAPGYEGVTLREMRASQSAMNFFAALPSRLATALVQAQSCASGAYIVTGDGASIGSGSDEAQHTLQTLCKTLAAEGAVKPSVRLWSGAFSGDVSAIALQSENVSAGFFLPPAQMISVFTNLKNACIEPPTAH